MLTIPVEIPRVKAGGAIDRGETTDELCSVCSVEWDGRDGVIGATSAGRFWLAGSGVAGLAGCLISEPQPVPRAVVGGARSAKLVCKVCRLICTTGKTSAD